MYFQLILWIIISLVALIIDIFTSSFLFVWFAIGGIVALILALLHVSFFVQIVVFVILSVILLSIGYPMIKKSIKNNIPVISSMEEDYIGKEFVSKEAIEDKATIKVEGLYWSVINAGEKIEVGEKITIIGIQGNKFIIKKLL